MSVTVGAKRPVAKEVKAETKVLEKEVKKEETKPVEHKEAK